MNDGLLWAWSSPFIVQITKDNLTYNISESEASYFAIIPTVSMMVACILFATLCDIIGRKKTLLLMAIPGVTAWVLKAIATDVTTFYISQLLVGIDTGCYFSVIPIFVGEIANPKIRGLIGSLTTTSHYFGQFLVTVMGNYLDVSTTSYVCLPFPILFFILFLFVPESPIYYIMKDKLKDAKKSLWKLNRKNDIETDFLKLHNDVLRQISERGKWNDLVKIPSNRKALLIGLFLRISQFMGGISVFITSTQFIFENVPGTFPASLSAMICSFCTFLALFVAGTCIDKIGRKIVYTFSLTLGAVIFFLEALYFYLVQNLNKDLSALEWFPLGGMIIYIMTSSGGIGIIPSVMIGEIFSASIKAKANILMVFLIALISTISSIMFYQLFPVTGLSGPFLFFGLMNTISSVVSYLYLPETKGKTLEEIQQMFKGNA